jgi:hypothetical protein
MFIYDRILKGNKYDGLERRVYLSKLSNHNILVILRGSFHRWVIILLRSIKKERLMVSMRNLDGRNIGVLNRLLRLAHGGFLLLLILSLFHGLLQAPLR